MTSRLHEARSAMFNESYTFLPTAMIVVRIVATWASPPVPA
jgi:hypothetical protein